MATQHAAYDLVLKGGTLMDAAQNINDRRDVAFKDGKVAAVYQRIDPTLATEVVDVTGKLVTPGFIDLHGHFYEGVITGRGGVASDADATCLPAGVTTAVDAGTAGWANYKTMRDFIVPTKLTRVLACLHIGATGLLLHEAVGGELRDLSHADPDRTADAIKENPGYLVGVKIRMAHDAVSYWEAETALKRAREAADKAGVTLMVHVAGTPIPLPGILELLGPQDISTHAFNGSHENILDANRTLRPEVLEAVRRGVVMDTGDAGGVLNIDICKPAFREGFFPTTISTDMHTCDPTVRTVHGVNDLVSKSFALGQPLEDAVAAATSRPAKAIHMEREIGSLAPGMEGDAAVFSEQEGQFQWTNTSKQTVEGNFRLDTYLTIRSGSVVWREGQIVRATAE